MGKLHRIGRLMYYKEIESNKEAKKQHDLNLARAAAQRLAENQKKKKRGF